MSFFFDVWTREGFALVSDVRIMINGEPTLGHKIATTASSGRIPCAIAVCGEYPDAARSFFLEATATKDTLRDVAKAFARRWLDRFAGTREYSAVHLVGYERDEALELQIPQMWYWSNWSREGFRDRSFCEDEFSSFDQPIPRNNHIPYKVREVTGHFPDGNLMSELEHTRQFLSKHEPYFTWNGDTSFWRSAADTVGAAMNLLRSERNSWPIADTVALAQCCLIFLVDAGALLGQETVGAGPDKRCDAVAVTAAGVRKISWVETEGLDR